MKYRVLTKEEERELIAKCQEGDSEARRKLIKHNERLVYKVSYMVSIPKSKIDDAVQEGFIGLITAINRFDLSKDVKLSTYAVPYIYGYITHYLRGIDMKDNNNMTVSLFHKLEIPFDDKSFDIGFKSEIKEILMNSDLSEKQIEIIISYFGLFGNTPKSIEEIAKSYGKSREGVNKAKNKALEKLKTKCLKKQMDIYL